MSRYQNDPEYREMRKKQSREYHAAHRTAQNERRAAHYAANGHSAAARASSDAFSVARARSNQCALNALKDSPCVDCGVQYHPAAMEFDHVRGTKCYHISSTKMSRPDLADELAKCELRCANCHRTRHALEREEAATT